MCWASTWSQVPECVNFPSVLTTCKASITSVSAGKNGAVQRPLTTISGKRTCEVKDQQKGSHMLIGKLGLYWEYNIKIMKNITMNNLRKSWFYKVNCTLVYIIVSQTSLWSQVTLYSLPLNNYKREIQVFNLTGNDFCKETYFLIL